MPLERKFERGHANFPREMAQSKPTRLTLATRCLLWSILILPDFQLRLLLSEIRGLRLKLVAFPTHALERLQLTRKRIWVAWDHCSKAMRSSYLQFVRHVLLLSFTSLFIQFTSVLRYQNLYRSTLSSFARAMGCQRQINTGFSALDAVLELQIATRQ